MTKSFDDYSTKATVIKNLRVENRVNPIGIDVRKPLFSWMMESEIRGQRQTAYQLLVASGIDKLNDKDADCWNSGKVLSDNSVGIIYGGVSLKVAIRYFWTVIVWDKDGNCLKAGEEAYFETGLMDGSIDAWEGAQWIGPPEIELDADSIPVYSIDFSMQFEQGSTKGGIILGANDPRINDWTKNNYLIQGENYIYVELDVGGLAHSRPAFLNIYRKNYCSDDHVKPGEISRLISTALIRETVNKEGKDYVLENDVGLSINNANEPIPFNITSKGGALDISINNKQVYFISKMQFRWTFDWDVRTIVVINPMPAVQDVPCFSRLNDIGFAAPLGNKIVFSDYKISHYNEPKSEVFGQHIGATYTIFEGKPGVTIDGNSITVDGKESDVLAYADPSFKSIPMLRKEVTADRPIESARLYATARGIYEIYINGNRVGDDWFNPGYTQYNKRINYSTYDVTDMLKQGGNAIGAILSSGWWSDQMTYTLTNYNYWGDKQSLLAKLVINYYDGSSKTIVTDTSWKYFGDGPIIYAGFFNGETYDARKEEAVKGWSMHDYDDSSWSQTVIVPSTANAVNLKGEPTLTGKIDEPIRVVKVLDAEFISRPKSGEDVYIYDMGVNMVGVPEIHFPEGKAGQRITIRYAEILYPDLKKENPYNHGELAGMILTENLRAALVTDYYIMKGTPGGETYRPRFTFHGYRYIEISGVGQQMPADNIKGIKLSSIHQTTLSYDSSNELANQLSRNIMTTLYGNHVGIPTDCPQRDERMGWSGDAQVFARTATYFADMNQFYRGWESSMRDMQSLGTTGSFGNTPSLIPDKSDGEARLPGSSVSWPAAGVIPVWEVYKQYGNETIIREHYNSIKWYLEGVRQDVDEDNNCAYLVRGGGLAEHLAMQETNEQLVTNLVYIHLLDVFANMSDIVGETDLADEYRTLAANTRVEWNDRFVNADGKTQSIEGVVQDTQASYAVAFYYDVVNDSNRSKAIDYFSEACERGCFGVPYTITTGFVGTGKLLPALTRCGLHEVAYRMFESKEYPSWLYPVVQGATSIWERWNSYTIDDGFGGNNGMNSFNHYANGAVGEWMVNYQLGIMSDAKSPGFKHFILQPTPGGETSYVKGSYDSVYGRINSDWEFLEGGHLIYKTTVPSNTTATLFLPVSGRPVYENGIVADKSAGVTFIKYEDGKAIFELQSGNYVFSTITADGIK